MPPFPTARDYRFASRDSPIWRRNHSRDFLSNRFCRLRGREQYVLGVCSGRNIFAEEASLRPLFSVLLKVADLVLDGMLLPLAGPAFQPMNARHALLAHGSVECCISQLERWRTRLLETPAVGVIGPGSSGAGAYGYCWLAVLTSWLMADLLLVYQFLSPGHERSGDMLGFMLNSAW